MIFTFVVLTYNHQAFIIEHLESIKYQIEKFGFEREFQLIVADDSSRDFTVQYASRWLQMNRHLFVDSEILQSQENLGTCKNFTRTWGLIRGKHFKITAGDDIYSCENLFDAYEELQQFQLICAIPLILRDSIIQKSIGTILSMCASYVINQKRDYLSELKGVSVTNTPNTIYSRDVIESQEILDFINEFSVTEDFPMHVKLAELMHPVRRKLLQKTLVYYRRTKNSTYLIKNEKFIHDKIEVLKYLRDIEKRPIRKFIISSRIHVYRKSNSLFSALANLSRFEFIFRCVLSLIEILKTYRKFSVDLLRHQRHFDNIKKAAADFQADPNS